MMERGCGCLWFVSDLTQSTGTRQIPVESRLHRGAVAAWTSLGYGPQPLGLEDGQ